MNYKRFHVLQLYFVLGISTIWSMPTMGQFADTTKTCLTQCCKSDLSPVGMMINHVHPKRKFMFSYRYMSMGMNKKLSGTRPINDGEVYVDYLMSPQQMRMDMHMLMAMYGLSHKITLMAMVNYNFLTMNMTMLPIASMGNMMHSGHTHAENMNMAMNTAGVGDIKLYILYDLFNKKGNQFVISSGISIPTGNIQNTGTAANMYANARLPYAMQLGSGSFEIAPGITWLKNVGLVSVSVQATSIIRTNYNMVGYRLGNEITVNAWAAYQLTDWLSTSLRTEGTIIGKMQGIDPMLYTGNEPAANIYNYGGEKVNVYGGINLYMNHKLMRNNKFSIEYGIPVYQNLNGIQSALTSTLFAGWQIAF